MEVAVQVKEISKKYRLYEDKWGPLKEMVLKKQLHNEFYALKNITLDFPKGEAIGVLGKNGSGKSTLLKIITGIAEPTSGKLTVNGSLVFLDVSSGIDAELSGYENIFMKGILLGFSKKEMLEKVDDIIEFSELGEFIYQPVKNYSSGMKSKLGFAISVNVDPDVLIVDEALAVGDALFRDKCMKKMNSFKEQGKTIIFVSHDKHAIQSFCTKAAWIEKGELITYGDSKFVSSIYNDFMSGKKSLESIKAEINFIHAIEKVNYCIESDYFSLEICGYLFGQDSNYNFNLVVKNLATEEEVFVPIIRDRYSEAFPLNIDEKAGFKLKIDSESYPYFFNPGQYAFLVRFTKEHETIEFPLWAGRAEIIDCTENGDVGNFKYGFKTNNDNLQLMIENRGSVQQQVNRITFEGGNLFIEGVAFVRGYETLAVEDVSMTIHLINKETFERYIYPLEITSTEEITENPSFNPQGKIYEFSNFSVAIPVLELVEGNYQALFEYKMRKTPFYKLINLVWASKTNEYPSHPIDAGESVVKLKTPSKYLEIEKKSK
ncbi:ATP-binding cassette domain-containing protein [Virgibacillus halodenitrificans]|uniref:ABC transporter ATP-binding protein n=1 Tax=Virgibacillus halodenitrificans TaxID=1482 RepID=UPI00136ABD5B|nr:ABC transporter ATP-binding protein [Virgibacillus halodenitrificans]MYL47790.1 ATP-binding cassette domain-containing protein [Virgibacillus halodenitrificans]